MQHDDVSLSRGSRWIRRFHRRTGRFRAPVSGWFFVLVFFAAYSEITTGVCLAQRTTETQPAAAETGAAQAAVVMEIDADRAEAILDALRTGVRTWSADFTQVRRLKTLVRPLTAEGRVSLDAAGNIRWQLGVPPRTIALKLPTRMWVVYPRLKRAESYDLQAPGPFKDILPLLEAGLPGSSVPLLDRFEIESASVENGLTRVRLTPRSGTVRDMMPALTLEVDGAAGKLVASTVHFADGSSMRNEFRNILTNPDLEPGVFDVEALLGPDFEIDTLP